MWKKFAGLFTALVLAMTLAPSAFATGEVDVTSVVTSITGALVPIGSIGLAVLGVLVAIKIYKWVRRAM
ncbi:MAG: major capsid protein [Opitutus sp.]